MLGDEIYKRIMIMGSIKEATKFVETSDISKSDLHKLCKRYNIFIEEKSTKEEIINRFVKSTIGVKLRKKVVNRYHTR
jgi:hypothetical protein